MLTRPTARPSRPRERHITSAPLYLCMEISPIPARGDCLYLTRFTVDSEGSYYPACPELVARFLAEADQVPEIVAIEDLFRERLGIEAFAEIRRGPHVDDPFLSKTVQGVFFVMLAYYLGRAYPRPLRAVGFYSAGAIPAYVFSGALGFEQYLLEVSTFVNEYYRQRDEQGRRHELSQTLLVGGFEDDVVSFAARHIEEARLGGEAFIKDRRQAHIALVAGLTPAVEAVRDAAAAAFPAIAERSPALKRVNAAHLPLVDRRSLLPLLDEAKFHPPQVAIIGTCGQVVPPGCEDQGLLREVFVEALAGPMNTGESIQRIARECERVIAIGSEHGLRVFEGISPSVLPPMAIASARLLQEPQRRAS